MKLKDLLSNDKTRIFKSLIDIRVITLILPAFLLWMYIDRAVALSTIEVFLFTLVFSGVALFIRHTLFYYVDMGDLYDTVMKSDDKDDRIAAAIFSVGVNIVYCFVYIGGVIWISGRH